MLKVENLNQYYGGSHILRGLSFEVEPGKVTSLLGRNGVGKTTLMKCLMGLVKSRSGHIRFNDKERGSAFYRIAPELLIATDWERHSIVADLRGSFTGYDKTFPSTPGVASSASTPRSSSARLVAASSCSRSLSTSVCTTAV